MVVTFSIAAAQSLHLAEFGPPLIGCCVYLVLYGARARTLAREQRPVANWRRASFTTGVLLATAVQLPPFDDLADAVLVAHMLQHIVIGDIASLLIVLGLTGPVLQPVLRLGPTRPLRRLAYPLVAVALWAIDIYAWHIPGLYELAIEHDLVHALEHACLLWFGTLLWLALVGPLPKPRWFAGWWGLGYALGVRFLGAVLANALIWAQAVLYPTYRASDAARGISALSDQRLAGGVMMIEQGILTALLLGWLFYRLMRQDEDRQALMDLAARRGLELSDERAARAAWAGTTPALRERLLRAEVDSADHR